jgi:LAO/AO transport system kinase
MDEKRKNQALEWMNFLVKEGLEEWFKNDPRIKELLPGMKKDVADAKKAPTVAASELLSFLNEKK